MPLHTRLTLAFGALLVVLAAVLVALLTRITERYSAEVSQRLNASVAMYVTDQMALLDRDGVNRAALNELAHRVMTLNPSAEIYLLTTDGRILATLVPERRLVRRAVDLAPIRRFLAEADARPLYGDDPTHASRRRVFSVAPVKVEGAAAGYLYVVLGSERFESTTAAVHASYTLQIGLTIAAAVLAMMFAVGAGLFRALTTPLRQLAQRMQDWSSQAGIAAGERADSGAPGNEIAVLDRRFVRMARQIEQQLHDLKAGDALRRELIANVSHDLRTPLASMRGYLETVLLKGERLSEDQRRQYLETACRHCERLEGLIAALFELSKLESGAVVPQREEFSLSELLQDVALRFRLRAQQAGVELRARFDPAGPRAYGDIALIERVLENLLDNALRHTPAGGRVSLELLPDERRARVAVADTGSGIAVEDLPRAFDRFYRGGGQGRGARSGLGLAIVRRIVELHGQTVSLTSTPGVGTCVEFGLPLAPATRESVEAPKQAREESVKLA
jgi:two-component system, OmpR family, sensor kinase